GDAPYADVVTDARTLQPAQLFVALRGQSFDGHAFVAAARAGGAAGAVVDTLQDVPLPQIVVHDTLAALARAARGWRAAFSGPVIGVAGSNGKTTTKERTAAILSRAGHCLDTRGNLKPPTGAQVELPR